MAAGSFLAALLLFPEHGLQRGIADRFATKDVRVAPYHLVDQATRHIGESELVLLFCQAAVKRHLKQQVAQFFAQGAQIAPGNGVGHFVGFLQGIGRDGVEGLLEVPRAAALRGAQTRHQGRQAREGGGWRAVIHRQTNRVEFWCVSHGRIQASG